MAKPSTGSLSLEVVRTFLGSLPQAAAVFDPNTGHCLFANTRFVNRLGLGSPTALLPAGVPWSTPGAHHYAGPAGEVTLKVSPLPLDESPTALLLQETDPASASPVAGALQHTFPIGVTLIDRTTDQVVFMNQPFLNVWRLPSNRRPDEGSRLRAACLGYVLDAATLDVAWPPQGRATGRFHEVALTDGRALRLATHDLSSGHRWVVVEDVTEPKQQRLAVHESEIRGQESQRLESLSLLAGGIAHDLNNLLLVIITNTEILREEAVLEPTLHSAVGDIRLAAERASELSAKMLAYSGRGNMLNVRTDVHAILTKVVDELATPRAATRIALNPTNSDAQADIVGDPGQLHQLFKAIIINALESRGVQSIDVTVQVDTWSTEALSRLYLGDRLVSGPYAAVTVTDDGEGIEATVLQRIFDPFFSTRGPSRGLGLAAAAGIARGHGGTIDVRSRRGQGARICVVLPVVQSPNRVASTTTPKPTLHTGTVLLVDDETLVRRSARHALEQAGFQVVEAENGEYALKLFSEQPERFQLVIMDISMPGAPGDQVAQQMRRLTEPPVPLVLSSGYRPQLELGPDKVADRFLRKPYRRAELVQTAKDLLEDA